jgi:hypothetical protein
MSSKQSSVAPSNSKAKIAERIAFDPFLPQQDIINEFIRNTINPDIDSGVTYYLGQVIDIIDPEDPSIDQKDIFYSYTDNSERINKTTNGKKNNKKRKILLVHIPSFLTNSKKSVSKLNYDSFTKIRVEYFDNVEIGNIVKIQFQDKNSFYNPHILSVDTDIKPDFIQQTETAVKAFKEYLSCKVLNLNFPTSIGENYIKKSTRPSGGYTQALKEIGYIFSDPYICSFKKGLKQSVYGDIEKIIIKVSKVIASPEVVSAFTNESENPFAFIGSDSISKKYLLVGEDVIISAENSEKNNQLKSEFYNYVKLDLDSRRGFTFLYEEADISNKFSLDINSNFIINKNEKILQDYIDISRVLLTSYEYSEKASPIKSNSISTASQIAKPKEFSDSCDSALAKDKTTYEIVHDGIKIDPKSAPKSDIKIITAFSSSTEFNTESYINPQYFIDLIGVVPKKDKKFYTNETNDKYILPKGEKNSFNLDTLESGLNEISAYLKRLKTQIEKLESYPKNSNNVLILPIQVFKKRTYPLPIGKIDNSRHYYAKAFDIRVYLKTGKVVYQIPPEIVALYCELESVKYTRIIGQGVFREYRYNHIEFIDNLLPSEQKSRRLYTSGKKDPIEESIEKTPEGEARISKLKEIVRQGANYISPTTKQLDPRFDLLTQ